MNKIKKKLLITGAALIILLIVAVKYSSSHRGPVTDVPIVSHDTYSITYTESLQKEIDKIDYEKLNCNSAWNQMEEGRIL